MIVPLSEHYHSAQADLLRETAFKIGQYIPRAQIDKIASECYRCSHILGAVSTVEKKEYRGIHRIREETGINVHKILDVSIAEDKTHVTYDRYLA